MTLQRESSPVYQISERQLQSLENLIVQIRRATKPEGEPRAKVYNSIKSVAARLGVHRETIAEWMKSGALKYHKKGKRTYLFIEDEIVQDIKRKS